MSEAEAVALFAAYLDTLAVWLSIYLSATFAYLVVAHTVGTTLNRFQTRVISTIYVVASLFSWGGMFGSQLWLESLVGSNPNMLRTPSLKVVTYMKFWEVALGVLVLSGIVVSLYYLHDIRRSASSKPVLPDLEGHTWAPGS